MYPLVGGWGRGAKGGGGGFLAMYTKQWMDSYLTTKTTCNVHCCLSILWTWQYTIPHPMFPPNTFQYFPALISILFLFPNWSRAHFLIFSCFHKYTLKTRIHLSTLSPLSLGFLIQTSCPIFTPPQGVNPIDPCTLSSGLPVQYYSQIVEQSVLLHLEKVTKTKWPHFSLV